MRALILLIFAIPLFLNSCTDDYEQRYDNFSQLDNTVRRLKGWFPDFVKPDNYDFKEIHHLENNASFGTFSYKNFARIDSVLNQTEYKLLNADSVKNVLSSIIKPKKPDWFLKPEEIEGKMYYRKNWQYIINDADNKKIYFINYTGHITKQSH